MARTASDLTHRVVVNGDGRYSVWPTYVDIPPGWWEEGTSGSMRLCLERVEEVWEGMRPSRQRDHVASGAGADHG